MKTALKVSLMRLGHHFSALRVYLRQLVSQRSEHFIMSKHNGGEMTRSGTSASSVQLCTGPLALQSSESEK